MEFLLFSVFCHCIHAAQVRSGQRTLEQEQEQPDLPTGFL
jgi:hypothetical protein